MKRKVYWGLAFIILIIVGGILLLNFNENNNSNTRIDKHTIIENELDIVYGSDTADITIFMYSSYSCAFCRKFLINVFPQIDTNFIKTGLVKFVIKYVDLANDANMQQALKTAICINEFGNFEYINKLLLMDPKVIYSNKFHLVVDELIENDISIAECILGGSAQKNLTNNAVDFKKLSLTGTPSFVINNKIFKGFKTYKVFEEVIQKELSENNIY